MIFDKQADYVLALEGNQGSLREDVEVFVAEQETLGFKHCDNSHGDLFCDHESALLLVYGAIDSNILPAVNHVRP
jgi:hypothetical protein